MEKSKNPRLEQCRQIASFEEIAFDFCECIDVDTGEEVRHPKGKCIVPGLVITKIMYSAEELKRRQAEDTEILEVFCKSRKQVCPLPGVRRLRNSNRFASL